MPIRAPLTLPPIHALVAFEAAGTHGNFTLAARELKVTREAVSMQIRTLETELGLRLFTRQQRGVTLTDAGRVLHAKVSRSLRQISEACNDLRTEREASLTLTTSVAFGSCWLVPRLLEFQKSHPDIKLRLIETDDCIDLAQNDVDFGLRYGKGTWPKLNSVKLFEEAFFPVCSPDHAKALDLHSVDALQDATLLHLGGGAHAWEDWGKFFALSKARFPMPGRGLWFNNYDNLLKAAVGGQGVALGWTRLVEDLLRDGRLICPLSQEFHTGNGYYLVESPGVARSTAQTAFRDWVLSFVSPNPTPGEAGA